MEAPNLERTSSLTWSGIGGLNWDRNSVLSSMQDQPRGRTASASVVISSSATTSRLGSAFSSTREDPSIALPIAGVDALLADEDDFVPPPSLLRRSVTFSGDFPHEGELDPLVATPPGLLNVNGMNVQANAFPRQRATSDAVTAKLAWGANEPGSLSPEATPYTFSPMTVSHKLLPRRSHSMSLEPTVWGPESPRERSRTANTLSVGSPDTEVLEYMDGDDLGFNARDSVLGSSGLPTRLQSTQYASPRQHGMFASGSSGSGQTPMASSSTAQSRFGTNLSAAGSQSGGHVLTPQQMQQFASAQANRISSTPQYNAFMSATGNSGGQYQGMGAGAGHPPAENGQHTDPNLIEIQLQNLQAMQHQWLQMMQMQFDQTLYATQQRLQNMQMSGNTHQPFAAVPPKVGKYPSASGNGGGMGGYDATPFSPQNPHMFPQAPSGTGATSAPININGGANTRMSPPSNRQHRRTENNVAGPSSAQIPASSLLAEHKITGRRLTAQELAGHVVEFSRDSHGSRLIQYKMETGTPEERRAFVNEALPHSLSLARDLFGNYVVQNFFDNAAQDQRDMLASSLKGNIISLCTHPHGCRVVQRALFVISTSLRNDIIDELLEINGNPMQTENIIRTCSRDAHATHVLQKAVACLQKAVGLKNAFRDPPITPDAEDPPQERERAMRSLEKIEECVLADCIPLSMHQQACRLVQRVLGACDLTKSSQRVNRLITEVFKNIDVLAVHQNGNFVLQHMIECAEPGLANKVQNYVCSNAVRLARHKFGSHLVEKCLACASPAQANAIVERFLAPLTPELSAELKDDFESSIADDTALGLTPSTLPVLMKDPYANFVVQKAFDVSRGDVRNKLSQEIRARTASLSKFSYGRHILTHINKAGSGAPGE